MITVNNLHYSYTRKSPVFKGLSLHLQPGFIYGLLGKNGTGKSTLLKNIAGLLLPRLGTIDVAGYRPAERNPDFLSQVFLLPEEFFLPPVTPARLAKAYAPFYPRFSQQDYERYLSEFAVPADQAADEMSMGQKKKAFISFGLACNTPLLLMDEPTNGLDIISKSQFRKIIAGAVNEEKCIIISTHQVKDIENLIDRITIIDEGSILFDHTIQEVAQRLFFDVDNGHYEEKDILFAEPGIRGRTVLVANDDSGKESRADLELLYKAVLHNPQRIRQLFKV